MLKSNFKKRTPNFWRYLFVQHGHIQFSSKARSSFRQEWESDLDDGAWSTCNRSREKREIQILFRFI